MSKRELIELLETFEDDAEIVIATQPNHPLLFTLGGVADGDDDQTIYICTGPNAAEPYGSRSIWERAGA